MTEIKLNDYEINAIHGLLVDEENRLKKIKELFEKAPGFENTNNYILTVEKLRQRFTEIDKSEDFCNVFERIEGVEK